MLQLGATKGHKKEFTVHAIHRVEQVLFDVSCKQVALLFPDDSSDDSIWVKCRNGRDEQNAQSKKGASKSNHATLRGERGTSKLGTAKAGNAASKQNRLVHGDAVPNLNIRIDAAGSKPAHS